MSRVVQKYLAVFRYTLWYKGSNTCNFRNMCNITCSKRWVVEIWPPLVERNITSKKSKNYKLPKKHQNEPSKTLISEHSVLRLSDFGKTKIRYSSLADSALVQTDTVHGTPLYSAPEMLGDKIRPSRITTLGFACQLGDIVLWSQDTAKRFTYTRWKRNERTEWYLFCDK